MSQEPPVKIKTEAPVKRTLAYQQALTQPREEPKKDAETPDIPAFETVTTEDGTTPAGDPSAIQDIPAQDIPAASDPTTSQDMAALPGEGAPAQTPNGAAPGQPLPWATDQAEQWGDERRQQMPDQAYGRPVPPANPYGQQGGPPPGQRSYGPPPGQPYGQQGGPPPGGAYGPDGSYDAYAPPRDPYAAQRDPYTQGDPYSGQADPYGAPPPQQWGGQPGAPPGEQWVQVVGSGTGMRSTASIDAPILFAFPYGRQLKVVTRNDEWVEVTDPNSSAKGWMPAHALAPSAGPNAGYDYSQQQAYEEQQPRRRGLFRRGGFEDMINRAFGN